METVKTAVVVGITFQSFNFVVAAFGKDFGKRSFEGIEYAVIPIKYNFRAKGLIFYMRHLSSFSVMLKGSSYISVPSLYGIASFKTLL